LGWCDLPWRLAVKSEIQTETVPNRMMLLRRPPYQRTEGADDDRWLLVFDTDAKPVIVEQRKQARRHAWVRLRIKTEETELAAFVGARGQGQRELVQLLSRVSGARKDSARN
jgi:ABC-type uncharacterized transport system ATPase subunit